MLVPRSLGAAARGRTPGGSSGRTETATPTGEPCALSAAGALILVKVTP